MILYSILMHILLFTQAPIIPLCLDGTITDSSTILVTMYYCSYLKKNQNAPRPSEHPPVMGENVKTFRWDQRLQIQNYCSYVGV